MLNIQQEITGAKFPLLMQANSGSWKLVVNVAVSGAKYEFHIVEKIEEKLSLRIISQDSAPFYVGADVWELDYGATLMTLQHTSLCSHPANELWQQWQQSSA